MLAQPNHTQLSLSRFDLMDEIKMTSWLEKSPMEVTTITIAKLKWR